LKTKLTETKSNSETIYTSIQNLKTDFESMVEYYNNNAKLEHSSKKARKNIERMLTGIKNSYKSFDKDYLKYLKYIKMKEEIEKIQNNLYNTESFIKSDFKVYSNILLENKFIEEDQENNKYKLSQKGEIAMNIHEIDNLAITDIIVDGEFNNLTPQEIVCILSIFTDIRLTNDNKINNIDDIDIPCKTKVLILKIIKQMYKYYDILDKYQVSYDKQYTHYDVCEYMYKWCNINDEKTALKMYENAYQWGISVGDFIKAIKKINNIVEELQKICILQENLKLLHILNEIPSYTQKSVATNQSLYI